MGFYVRPFSLHFSLGGGGWHLPGGSSKYSQLGAVQHSSECLVYWMLETIGHNQKQLVTRIRMEPEKDQICQQPDSNFFISSINIIIKTVWTAAESNHVTCCYGKL